MDKYNLCLEGQGVERLAIDYSIRDYPIGITYLAEGEPYVADISDLIYCSTLGDTS